jgi:hypothetical protein
MRLLDGRVRDQRLQILRRETSPLGDTGQHARPYLLVVMKGEYNVCPARAGQCAVGAALALDLPTNSQQSRENAPRSSCRPLWHPVLGCE